MLEKLLGRKNARDLPNLATLPYMVHWYGPGALTKTGLLTVISGLFGQFADQRIMQAALDTRDPRTLIDRYDYSRGPAKLPIEENEPLWIDYIADLGDGFDSTYALASLLAADEISVAGTPEKLPAGRLLILGGDAVYPYASEEEYQRRFIQPYDLTVWHKTEAEREDTTRRLFMLPGNHDWYDGLAAFDRLFCTRRDDISEGRLVGPYRCRQHRSYFAIKLPHDWWIWGLDTQLSSNVDVGQIKYFHAVAEQMKASFGEAKIILCIPEPAWYHGADSGAETEYSPNLQRILNLAIDTGKVCTVIAGDWHHYSRYFGLGHRLNLITAGGGGAYLAPTHHLKRRINVPWTGSEDAQPQLLPFTLHGPASTDDKAVAAAGITVDAERRTAAQTDSGSLPPESMYPPRKTSRRLSWKIPFAPIRRNWSFMGGLGVFYWLMTWMFATSLVHPKGEWLDDCKSKIAAINAALKSGATSLVDPALCERPVVLKSLIEKSPKMHTSLLGLERPNISFGDYLGYAVDAAVHQIALAAFAILVLFMLYSFSGVKNRLVRTFEALFQWVLHVAAMIILYEHANIWVGRLQESHYGTFLVPPGIGSGLTDLYWHLVAAGVMIVAGGIVGGFIWGMYLFLGNRVFGTLHDNAFSILRLKSHKHFLRLKITPDSLTIYPIALRKIPGRSLWFGNHWRKTRPDEVERGIAAAFVPSKPLAPELIEGPIVIRPAEVRNLTPGPHERHHRRAIVGLMSAVDKSKPRM